MIWESWYWRDDLTKFASSLLKRTKQKRWPDAALARCEQTIMVGFFYVRKLIESKKLSRNFATRNVKVTAYPSKGTHVHWMNYRRDVDELFDMDQPKPRSIKIEDLANQIIHSYVFYLTMGGGHQAAPLTGVLVASDYIRNAEIFEVSIKDILAIFQLAAKGEADKTREITYDKKRDDYVVRILKN
jgi:hypothetical protein